MKTTTTSATAALLCSLIGTSLAAQGAPVAMTLGEALARGRSSGVQAALAQLSARGTALRRDEFGAARLPQIDGGASMQRQTVNLHEFGLSFPGVPGVTDPFTLFRARLGATQLLFDRATVERLRTLRDTAIAAGLDAERAGDLASAAAGAAWLRLAGAQQTVLAREADSVTAFALRDIARSQVDAGISPRIDRTRSENRAAAIRLQIAVARNERDRAQLDLARAVDLPPGTVLLIGATINVTGDTLPSDITAAVALAKAHRVDLAAERQRLAASEQSLGAIRSEYLPSLVASGFVQTSGPDGFNNLAGTWNLGLGLSWSIFDGFRRDRRADEQRLRIDAGKVRLHDLEAQVEADVRQAALDVASSRDQVTLATDQVRLAEEELAEARERFAAGVAGSVETTNAQAELAAARDALIQARLAAGAAQINAARALGLLNQVH